MVIVVRIGQSVNYCPVLHSDYYRSILTTTIYDYVYVIVKSALCIIKNLISYVHNYDNCQINNIIKINLIPLKQKQK